MSKLHINFNGKNYKVSNSALSGTRADFIAHLITIAGEGLKIIVDGVEYSVDPTKLDGAVSELETVIGSLNSGGGSDSGILPAGLYDANGVMLTSWEDLIANGTVLVDNGVVSTGDNSEALSGALVLPNDGSITSIGNSAFLFCSELESVTIPDSVTYIGNQAFWNCTSLTNITIPDSVESIGSQAFASCTSFTRIEIPDNVTSIGEKAFYGCKSLTSATIGNGVTSISDSAFYLCSNLESVTIPNSVTSIGSGAFRSCKSLTSITIPDSVTNIGNSAFNDCTSLASIIIPDGVTSISEYAFYSCAGIENITIPDSVTNIGSYAFGLCSNLTYMTFEGTMAQWDAIEKYLYWSSGVSITYVQCADGQALFDNTPSAGLYNDSGVMTASWSELLTNGVIHMDNGIVVSNYDVETRENTSSEVLSGTLVLPKDGSVTSIGKYAFTYCTKLVSIQIPDSVTSIGANALVSTGLTSATFDNPIGWYVTKTEGATSGTAVTLSLPSQNAKYFKQTYRSHYWYRTTTIE